MTTNRVSRATRIRTSGSTTARSPSCRRGRRPCEDGGPGKIPRPSFGIGRARARCTLAVRPA
jgi:hypothetical protein